MRCNIKQYSGCYCTKYLLICHNHIPYDYWISVSGAEVEGTRDAHTRGGTSNEKFWAHLTEASIWVIDRILINKNCILLISRLPRPSFWATFDQKMAKFRFFSYYSSTMAPRKMILDMHTHISPSYNNWSLTLTSKVTGGHWEVIRGQKGQYIYFLLIILLTRVLPYILI